MSREPERSGGSQSRAGAKRHARSEGERSEPSAEVSGEAASSDGERSPLFLPVIYVGGLVFGFGLAISGMAKPEIVLDFLQFEDFGLLFVMGGAAAVTGVTFAVATRFLDRAPLTGDAYRRRLKSFDRNVVAGGTIFGVGWGLSGICPGAAYASVGIGNYPILWAIAGMFLGAYAHGYARSFRTESTESLSDAPTN